MGRPSIFNASSGSRLPVSNAWMTKARANSGIHRNSLPTLTRANKPYSSTNETVANLVQSIGEQAQQVTRAIFLYEALNVISSEAVNDAKDTTDTPTVSDFTFDVATTGLNTIQTLADVAQLFLGGTPTSEGSITIEW